ncbi:MAG: hypothetical protein PHT12_00270 [Patescibacteria group bacterium]|nr:hypothetical protein [Patescibacteria group bacterium]
MWKHVLGYFRQFAVLKGMRREYWGVQSINFLDCLYGFAFGTVSTIFMSQTLGFSDIGAGAALSWLGIFTSVFLFASGPIVDHFGLKKSLFLSIFFVILMRGGMALCAFWPLLPHHEDIYAWFAGIAGLTGDGSWFHHVAWRPYSYLAFLALGGLPVSVKNTAYHIGNKRFTTAASQSAGFNLWYIIMNVSAVVAGLVVDLFRTDWHLHYGWFIVLGVGTAVLSLLSTWLLIKDERPAEERDRPQTKNALPPPSENEAGSPDLGKVTVWLKLLRLLPVWSLVLLTMTWLGLVVASGYVWRHTPRFIQVPLLYVWRKLVVVARYTRKVCREPSFWRMMATVSSYVWRHTPRFIRVPLLFVWRKLVIVWRYTRKVCREPSFWRMMAAVTLNLGVSSVFIYWSMISPKYWDRTIGPDAAIGKLSAINPVIIVVGLVLLVPIINKFKTFTMLTWGSFISAGSLIPLVIPWYWVSSDPRTAYYATSIVSMVVFSFGEMMFSPRLSQYILAVAPVGQEGIYSSFAALPSFVRSTIVGFTSGVMLTRWCPETRVLHGVEKPLREVIAARILPYWDTPEAMWLILTVAAIVGPILMVVLHKWFVSGMRHDTTVAAN